MLSLGANDPFRAPYWRFERVRQILEGARIRPKDDPYVRRMVYFLRRWNAAQKNERAMGNVAKEFPECVIAWRLGEARADPDKAIVALLIEARLLARVSFEEVARLNSTSAAAIGCYEAIYFNVTDRLDMRDWVLTQVVLPAIQRQQRAAGTLARVGPMAEPFLEGSTKLFAYYRGPFLVDVMASRFGDLRHRDPDEDLGTWFDDHWRRTIRRRCLQSYQPFVSTKSNVRKLFAAHLKLQVPPKDGGKAKKAKIDWDLRLKLAFDCLPPLPVGRAGITDPGPCSRVANAAKSSAAGPHDLGLGAVIVGITPAERLADAVVAGRLQGDARGDETVAGVGRSPTARVVGGDVVEARGPHRRR